MDPGNVNRSPSISAYRVTSAGRAQRTRYLSCSRLAAVAARVGSANAIWMGLPAAGGVVDGVATPWAALALCPAAVAPSCWRAPFRGMPLSGMPLLPAPAEAHPAL